MTDVVVPQVGRKYRLRDGSLVEVTGQRDAIMLNGKDRESIFVGKFLPKGDLCAWNENGTYRASNKRATHSMDIVEEAR